MSTNSDLPRSDDRAVAVRLRDRDQCQACKRTAAEVGSLEVHRIVPHEETVNQLSNYVLLCQRCHNAAHTDEGPDGE
jgi:5-methylcytosine-specific restriction endonuclease McrA